MMKLSKVLMMTDLGTVTVEGDWENGSIRPYIELTATGEVANTILEECLWTAPGTMVMVLRQGLIKAAFNLYSWKFNPKIDSTFDIAMLLLVRMSILDPIIEKELPSFIDLIDKYIPEDTQPPGGMFAKDLENSAIERLRTWIAIKLYVANCPIRAMALLTLARRLYILDPTSIERMIPTLEMASIFMTIIPFNQVHFDGIDMSHTMDMTEDYVFPPQIVYEKYYTHAYWLATMYCLPCKRGEIDIFPYAVANVAMPAFIKEGSTSELRMIRALWAPEDADWENYAEEEMAIRHIQAMEETTSPGIAPIRDSSIKKALEAITDISYDNTGNIEYLKHVDGISSALEQILISDAYGMHAVKWSLSFEQWVDLIRWYQDRDITDSVRDLLFYAPFWPMNTILKEVTVKDMLQNVKSWTTYLEKVAKIKHMISDTKRDFIERLAVLNPGDVKKKTYHLWRT